MGCFSWLDCKTGKSIKIGQRAFLLIPKEFSDIYGSHIETIYGGYGNFGFYDVYDLVARWNLFDKKKCISNLEIPQKEEYLNEDYYNRAVNRYLRAISDILSADTENEEDDLREIGINIACYDKQNKALRYPIKISKDENAVYEDCKYSKADPSQGCY